jgi:WD40 repeat protein
MADIFISHSGKDNEIAAAIGERIRRERPTWSLFYDKDNIRAGQRWQERLREELQSCRMVIVLLSRNWLASPWCFTEAVTASFRGKDLVPLETEDLTSDDLARAPPIVHERQRVRLRDGDDRAWQEVLEALDRSGLDPNDWFPIPPNVGPYPGLVAFDEKDAGVFFGRKQEITEYLGIVDTLRGPDRSQMLVISGASGSGKSSLLRAGLIPRLRRKSEWVAISSFEVARDPVRNLLDRLDRTLADLGISRDGLDLTTLPGDARALARILNETLRRVELATGAWVLLSFDQAEALVAGVRLDGDPGKLLLDGLAHVLGQRTRRLVVAATIRTEFIPRLEEIYAASNVGLRHAPLSPIASLAEIIEKPADRFGIELEPGLSERIVEDVRTADALPLLAYTLKALSDRRGTDRRLTLEAYQILGGVQGAIAAKLALVLSDPEPTAEEVTALRRAFTRYLIRVDEGAVEGERLLRRVVRRETLPQSAVRLIGRLVDAGLLTAKNGTIELAHERIIGDWPNLPLNTWLVQDATDRRLIDQLHQRLNDDTLPDGLHSQADDLLQRDHQLADEEPALAQLMQRSRDQRGARERRRRLVLGIVGFVALVFAGVAGFALVQRGEAISQTQAAERATETAHLARKQAEENAIAADAATKQAQVERDRARMQLLAIQARRAVAQVDTLDEIERAGALALESIEIARQYNHPTEPDAIEAARVALSRLPLEVRSHGSLVRSLAVLPDGRLASGGNDGEIKLWPRNGMGEPVILKHGGPIGSLVVLADGRLASGGQNGQIKLWPRDGVGEPVILSHGSAVRSMAVLVDGRLASGGGDTEQVKLWPRDGVGEPVILQQGSRVLSLAALADGRLASVGYNGQIKLWPRDGIGDPLTLSHGFSVASLAVVADGRLASGDFLGQIKLWPRDGAGAPAILNHGSMIWSLVSLADGRLASGGNDGQIKIWSQDGTGGPVILRHAQSKAVSSLAVLADGRLASGGDDGIIKLWPRDGLGEPVVIREGGGGDGGLKLRERPTVLLPHHSKLLSLGVLADGRFASGTQDGHIKLWPQDGVTDPVILRHGDGPVASLVVLADGRLVSGGDDGQIKLWPRDGKGEPMILRHGGKVSTLAVLRDGRLASGGVDTQIKLWPRDGVGEPLVLANDSTVLSLAALTDGRLASGDFEGQVKLWPPDGMGEPLILRHNSPVHSLAVLPDGRLASGGVDGQIRLWPPDGAGEPEILRHNSPVLSLVLLPDGRLASGGIDREIRLWPRKGAGAPVILSQGSPVRTLAVLADGRLASGGYDGQIKLWIVGEEALAAALCLRAGRNLRKDEWVRYIGSDTPWQPSCRNRPSNWRTPDP